MFSSTGRRNSSLSSHPFSECITIESQDRTTSSWSYSSTGSGFSSNVGVDGGTIVSDALAKCSTLGWKIREEIHLLKRQWLLFVSLAFFLGYVNAFVFLNLAFYRYPVEEADRRLKDLGHEIVPELEADLRDSGIVDLPLNTLMFITVFMLLSLFVNNASAGRRNPKPHLVNVIIRTASVYALGSLARAGTFLSTSPPGSGDHCLADAHPERFKPTLAECFYKMADLYHNCGDLMFSGHMLLMICLMLCMNAYAEAAFWISRGQRLAVVCVALGLCVIESYLIIASRHHYTSDVVVAWYLSPLLWYYHSTALSVRDMKPDLEAIAREVLKKEQPAPTISVVGDTDSEYALIQD